MVLALFVDSHEVMKDCKIHLVVLILIILVCILSNINYFLHGMSVYAINSVALSPLSFLKLQIGNFRALDFYPQYWTNLISTGVPIHTGIGMYNPLLLFLVFFSKFSDSIIFYDILLKIIGGTGVFCLLRCYRFSTPSALCCSLIYPLNPYAAVIGRDIQFGTVIYFAPWIILCVERIVGNPHGKRDTFIHSIALALILAAYFLSGNIQTYACLLSFVIVPYTIIRLFIDADISPNKIIKTFLYLGLAVILSILLVAFEIIPTFCTIINGNISVGFDYRVISYALLLTVLAVFAGFVLGSKKRLFGFVVIFVIVILFLDGGQLFTFFNRFFTNYRVRTEPLIIFRGWLYFVTFMQFLLLCYMAASRKGADRRLVLFWITLAHLLFTCIFILVYKDDGFVHGLLWSVYDKVILPDSIITFKRVDYFLRFCFVAFVGMPVGLAWAMDCFRERLGKGNLRYVAMIVLSLLVAENCYIYLNRTVFVKGLKYVEEECAEYDFLRQLRRTERVMDVNEKYFPSRGEWLLFPQSVSLIKEYKYSDIGNVAVRPFPPKSFPKWLVPAGYFGVNTFSIMGINVVPKEVGLSSALACDAHWYGLPEKRPLSPILSQAGEKYIFSYNKLQKEPGLKLIMAGDEYFVYENVDAWPRIMLFSKVRQPPAQNKMAIQGHDSTQEVVIVNDDLKILLDIMRLWSSEPLESEGVFVTSDHLKVLLEIISRWRKEDLLKMGIVYVSDENGVELSNSGENEITSMDDTSFASNLGKVKIAKYEDEYIEIDCDIRQECFFMITDTFYPGWNAYVGEARKEIMRANYMFRGLKMCPGSYTLIFKYEPPMYRYALMISFSALIIVVSALAWLLVSKRSARRTRNEIDRKT